MRLTTSNVGPHCARGARDCHFTHSRCIEVCSPLPMPPPSRKNGPRSRAPGAPSVDRQPPAAIPLEGIDPILPASQDGIAGARASPREGRPPMWNVVFVGALPWRFAESVRTRLAVPCDLVRSDEADVLPLVPRADVLVTL